MGRLIQITNFVHNLIELKIVIKMIYFFGGEEGKTWVSERRGGRRTMD